MPTNLCTRHTWSTKSSSQLWLPSRSSLSSSVCPFPISCTLSQVVRPDVKGNIVEGRGSPNNEGYTASPNLILQQMAKCNLWPWQIAVLVKPSSSIRKKWEKQTDEVERSWNGGDRIQRWDGRNISEERSWKVELNKSTHAQRRRKKGGPDGEGEESHELNLTDLGKINNQNFSGSNRSERELRRKMSENQERPIKSNIRMATSGTRQDETTSRKTTQSCWIIIMSEILWSLVISDVDGRRSWMSFN